MNNRILIIEDDNEISNMIVDYLRKNGHETFVAKDGITGIKKVIEKKPDLIILDIMLPYKSVDEVLREVREFSDIPIIVVSAKENVQFKVDLFKMGVDDYVVKPFDLSELLARIEMNLKKYTRLTSKPVIYKYKDITLNYDLKEVLFDNNIVKLTSKEFEILYLFLKYPSKVFSKKNIYETVWGDSYAYDNDTINTHISNIKNKIDCDLIETVWGRGIN